ncbi:hypothetical protein ABBQ32_004006 [Trebouxia sp. C0010 RCD-2024]
MDGSRERLVRPTQGSPVRKLTPQPRTPLRKKHLEWRRYRAPGPRGWKKQCRAQHGDQETLTFLASNTIINSCVRR